MITGVRRLRALELGQRIPGSKIDLAPIIEPGPFQLPIFQRKAKRLDQMQRRASGETKPAHVARVRRNLRLNQNDVKTGFIHRFRRFPQIQILSAPDYAEKSNMQIEKFGRHVLLDPLLTNKSALICGYPSEFLASRFFYHLDPRSVFGFSSFPNSILSPGFLVSRFLKN